MAIRPPKPPGRPSSPRHRDRKGAKGADKPEKSSKPSIHALSREIPSIEEFNEIDREVHFVHDRAAAILMASQVERFLEIAIIARLSRVDQETIDSLVGRDGPLSTFSSKIRLAYAMRVIEAPERDDLNKIREIRNLFAHAMRPIKFDNELVIDRIRALYSAAGHSPDDLELKSGLMAALIGRSADPNRLKFIEACRKLSSMILSGISAPRS